MDRSSDVEATTSPPPDSPMVEDDDINDFSEEGEELINETMEEDYRAIPELDTYEQSNIDNQTDFTPLDARDRIAADRMMNQRDRREGGARRDGFIPRALRSGEDDEDIPVNIFQRRQQDWNAIGQRMDDQESGLVNLEDFQGPLREWLEEPRVMREVKNRFQKFLTEFRDQSGNLIYPDKIQSMCSANGCSLDISYMHLSQYSPILAIWLADAPQQILALYDEVLMRVVKYEFSEYDKIESHIHTRVKELPLHDQLRELRQMHLNALIQVSGVVTRRTNVFPQLQLVKFDCMKCGFIIGPFAQHQDKETRPPSCPDCQSNGPFRLNESQTIYRNYQKIVLQESPGSVPAGRIPRSRDVILVDDLCDSVRPGEHIQVTGIYKNEFAASLNAQQGFPVFSTIIEANLVTKEKDFYSSFIITDDDRIEMIKLSNKPNLEELIINSIAPSIYGHESIKRAIAYTLFGGQEKHHKNKHRVRGDINMLILGDPGTAKSQFLKYIENVAFRAVYATGKGASAVGLTASVRRDPMTREWTLEGGALVLADRGVCLIDEFDKMNEQDRTSIHEAMEQQSISISKAGIIATLQARCSVIAAANPIRGRYDGSLTFVENVDLTDPILSRFDVLSVVRDRVDPIKDEQLAQFVVGNHMANHPKKRALEKERQLMENEDSDEKTPDNQVSQEMLKKYILHAKRNIHPKLDNIDRDKISKFYSDLRQKSMQGGGIPIAVRHIESIIRLSEARAKLHFREYVRDDDVDMAIRCLLESFIDTQKQSVQMTLRKHFKQYLTYHVDSTELLIHLLETLVKDESNWRALKPQYDDQIQNQAVSIDIQPFEKQAQSMQINQFEKFYKSQRFRQQGFTLDREHKKIIKSFQ